MKSPLIQLSLAFALFLPLVIPGNVASASDPSQLDGTPVTQSTDAHFSIRAHGDYTDEFFRDVPLAPGGSTSLEVIVTNWDDKPVDLNVFSTNARNSHNGGFIPGEMDEEQVGSTSWVEFPQTQLQLEADEQRILTFTINVPNDAAPGQYISALVAESVDTFPVPGEELIDYRLQYSISLSILVPGDITPSFTLESPTVDGQSLLVEVANTGNYLVQPQGLVELYDDGGELVAAFPIQMGSVYAGIQTNIDVWLPSPLPAGDYTLSAELVDAESGTEASLDREEVQLVNVVDERPHRLAEGTVQPNDVDIVFADVSVAIINDGERLESTNVVLLVFRDDELVDEFPLATNQVMLVGENTYEARYIPEDMWDSGTYTFIVVVVAVDPGGQQAIELLNEELDAEIVVP